MNSLTNNFASLRYRFSFLFKDESSTRSCSAAISIYAQLKLHSHQIWRCGAQHFPPFTVRPPADLLWRWLSVQTYLKLSLSQLFGCSSSYHGLAAFMCLQYLTSAQTTQLNTAQWVLLCQLTETDLQHNLVGLQPCDRSGVNAAIKRNVQVNTRRKHFLLLLVTFILCQHIRS